MARAKWKTCPTPRCPNLVQEGFCASCRAAADAARPSPVARGYGAAHKALRADWQARIDRGERVVCWRCHGANCGGPFPRGSTAWHLGHDDDRAVYRGPECVPCNAGDGGRKGLQAHRSNK